MLLGNKLPITILCVLLGASFLFSSCASGNDEKSRYVAVDEPSNGVENISEAVPVEVRAEVSRQGRVVPCKKAVDSLGKEVCRKVMANIREEDISPSYPFEITFDEVDLNSDGRQEIIVWESSWSGTSGGSLWVLQRKKGTLSIRFETEMTWSPIIIRDEITNGWKDFSYLVQGGGVEPTFRTVEYLRDSYKDSGRKVSSQQPTGEIVIGRNWQTSFYGPITK